MLLLSRLLQVFRRKNKKKSRRVIYWMNYVGKCVLDVFPKDFSAENEIKIGDILKNRYEKITC